MNPRIIAALIPIAFLAVPPLAPPNNLAIEQLRDRYTLTWQPRDGAASYRVSIRSSVAGMSVESAESASFSGVLKEPGLYEFRVTGVDAYGRESGRSRPIKAIRLHRPWGIALTKDGRRIVRDAHFPRQAVYSADGSALSLEGQETLKGSYDVAVDSKGRILTAKWGESETFGFVVQNPGFKVMQKYQRPAGSAPGELRQPMGIGADSKGNIFIADTGNHRIQQFTSRGEFKRIIGEGELELPMKVAFGSRDTLYVADSGNNRIAVYEADKTGEYRLARSIEGMKEPVYVAVDKVGRVFVSANRQAGVHMFGPDGKQLWKYEGDSVAHLSGPRGLVLDGKGNLLIIDEASLRILTVRISQIN